MHVMQKTYDDLAVISHSFQSNRVDFSTAPTRPGLIIS